MRRYKLEKLKQWLTSDNRKPLVLRGARQVGKTWLVRELAKQTGRELVELNFEARSQLSIHFESNDPDTILLNLESKLNININPQQTILFLDEIQAAPELLAKLRWFYEQKPELAIIAAGSLLEFVLKNHEFSMPVGRINYFFLGPLGFEEFLLAKNELHLLSAIQQFTFKNTLNTALHEKASLLYKEYMTVGGMPEAVHNWVNNHSFENLSAVHNDLINTYKDDFTKYAGKLSIKYLDDVLAQLPKMLGKKIMYSRINPESRHASIKQAFDLLAKARLCTAVYSTSANGIPIGAEKKSRVFKAILLDIGLVSTLLGLNLYQFKNIDTIMQINNGALAEQIVGQEFLLLAPYYIEPTLYYWNREKQNASAEVDYLIQQNNELIGIEVKSNDEGKLRSLHQFIHDKRWKRAVRFYAGAAMRSDIRDCPYKCVNVNN